MAWQKYFDAKHCYHHMVDHERQVAAAGWVGAGMVRVSSWEVDASPAAEQEMKTRYKRLFPNGAPPRRKPKARRRLEGAEVDAVMHLAEQLAAARAHAAVNALNFNPNTAEEKQAALRKYLESL